MTDEERGTLKYLQSSGYWLYRINSNQWAQWPRGRTCWSDDCFGWDRERTAMLANRAANAEELDP